MAKHLIEINADALKEVAEELQEIPEKIAPAVAVIINRTMKGVITEVKRAASSEYSVKQKDIAEAFTKKKGGGVSKATAQNLSSYADAAGGQIALYKFKHKPATTPKRQKYKSPVKVQVKKTGGEKVVRHNGNLAFMQNIKSKDGGDNHMIFAREGKARLPIKKLFALSVPQMLVGKDGTKPYIDKIVEKGNERLLKETRHEIKRRLEKIGEK